MPVCRQCVVVYVLSVVCKWLFDTRAAQLFELDTLISNPHLIDLHGFILSCIVLRYRVRVRVSVRGVYCLTKSSKLFLGFDLKIRKGVYAAALINKVVYS